VSLKVLNENLRPIPPKKTPENWTKLMKQCWARNPEKRPSAEQIIFLLETMKF